MYKISAQISNLGINDYICSNVTLRIWIRMNSQHSLSSLNSKKCNFMPIKNTADINTFTLRSIHCLNEKQEEKYSQKFRIRFSMRTELIQFMILWILSIRYSPKRMKFHSLCFASWIKTCKKVCKKRSEKYWENSPICSDISRLINFELELEWGFLYWKIAHKTLNW